MANKARFATTTTTITTLSVVMLSLLLMIMTMTVTTTLGQSSPVAAVTGRSGGGGFKLSQIDGKSLFRSLRASSCSVDCGSAKVEHVCGTDGVTYRSRCELQRAKQCDGKRGTQGARVKVRTKGACPGDTSVMSKCVQERDEARKVALQQSSDVLVPSCNEDGTYSDVQCHKTTGYCWCVTKDGRHIHGTSVKEGRPRCKGRRRKRKGGRNNKKKNKRKASCSNKDRQSFSTDLVNVFREEYNRMLSARGPQAVNDNSNNNNNNDDEISLDKKIVVWKFSQLDANSDDELSFREIRSFRRMVKKLIKPRRCAKRFHRYCDDDKNRRIEKKEWTICLWVDIKRAFRNLIPSEGLATENPTDKPGTGHLGLPLPPKLSSSAVLPPTLSIRPVTPNSGRKNKTDPVKKNCQEERKSALQHASEEPSANVYVPRCQENGLWRKAQCHEATQYCWCVSEESGMPLPGIATYKVEPNCSIRDDRQMKGCPFEQKSRFIVHLIRDMTKEMNKSQASVQQLLSPAELVELQSREREKVARWKLRSLDKDGNDILEKQEWRELRKTLKKNKSYPRKCRRQFLRYCDENNDKSLSMEEWRECLGLNHNLFNLPRDPNRFGKPNPFQNQLT